MKIAIVLGVITLVCIVLFVPHANPGPTTAFWTECAGTWTQVQMTGQAWRPVADASPLTIDRASRTIDIGNRQLHVRTIRDIAGNDWAINEGSDDAMRILDKDILWFKFGTADGKFKYYDHRQPP